MKRKVTITFNNCSNEKIRNLMSTNDISKAISYMIEEKITGLAFCDDEGKYVFTIEMKE